MKLNIQAAGVAMLFDPQNRVAMFDTITGSSGTHETPERRNTVDVSKMTHQERQNMWNEKAMPILTKLFGKEKADKLRQ